MSEHFREGDRVIGGKTSHVLTSDEANLLNSGGQLIVLPDRITVADPEVVRRCVAGVERARAAFSDLALVSDEQITAFFEAFSRNLEDDARFAPVAAANAADVADARSRGRSTGRLEVTATMRRDMVDSARLWARSPARKEVVVDQVAHEGWSVEKVASPLGVIAFVFEGRPNVCVDATGVLRTGNTCVFRIGSDAVRTARAIMEQCIAPALRSSGIPEDSVVLLDVTDRVSGLVLFGDDRISLAVARGSGQAVSELGFVAQSHGIATSLHGTGGAWMVLTESADLGRFAETMRNSLDRKVCNTLNVCCAPKERAIEVGELIIRQLEEFCEARESTTRLHLVGIDPSDLGHVKRSRVDLVVAEKGELGIEWEWDGVPEMFFVATASLDESFALCNQFSPQFIVSIISSNEMDVERGWNVLNAPFVGDGFTRWVDGQYALGRPELGLSNWQHGRALARGGILSGDDIRTFRYRMRQSDPSVRR